MEGCLVQDVSKGVQGWMGRSVGIVIKGGFLGLYTLKLQFIVEFLQVMP